MTKPQSWNVTKPKNLNKNLKTETKILMIRSDPGTELRPRFGYFPKLTAEQHEEIRGIWAGNKSFVKSGEVAVKAKEAEKVEFRFLFSFVIVLSSVWVSEFKQSHSECDSIIIVITMTVILEYYHIWKWLLMLHKQ